MIITEKLNGRETGKRAEEPAANPVNTAEGKEKHVLLIGAPKRVIAGEPFEVIVTVTGIPSTTYEQPHGERIELYLHNKLMGHKEITPKTDEETESIFKIGAEEALLAIKEIEMLSGEFREVEDVKNVFIMPEDRKEYLEKGP
jgi:desulfoferrodoxin (superoxide reductase-like protein)